MIIALLIIIAIELFAVWMHMWGINKNTYIADSDASGRKYVVGPLGARRVPEGGK